MSLEIGVIDQIVHISGNLARIEYVQICRAGSSAVIEKPFFLFSRQLMERHDERIVTHVF